MYQWKITLLHHDPTEIYIAADSFRRLMERIRILQDSRNPLNGTEIVGIERQNKIDYTVD